MAEQTVLVAIDIGTTKVCVLIGEIAERGEDPHGGVPSPLDREVEADREAEEHPGHQAEEREKH